MKNRRTVAAVLFILVGIGAMSYPWSKAWYFERVQNNIMQTWLQAVDSGEWDFSKAKETDPSLGGGSAIMGDEIWRETQAPSIDADYVLRNMEGVLTIQKIGLQSPILIAATSAHMDIAICSVLHTGTMGETGNYVLAGHNSYLYGRHFNRLWELVAGDLVEVGDGHQVYTYEVTGIYTVSPADIWVLEPSGEESILTLITCDYSTEPWGRIVVRAKLVGDVEN